MTWTFLTDHAHVLVVLARDPRADAGAVAEQVGLEPGAVETILDDLEADGYVERRPSRGAVTYTVIDRAQPLRHPVERHHPVGRLLDAVQSPTDVLRERLGVGG